MYKLTISTIILAATCSIASHHATPSSEPPKDIHEPNLCDVDPTLCVDCGGPGEITCDPQDLEGWLCCSTTGICVAVQTYDDCTTGIAGWCSDYSTETLRNGVEVAICEDT